MRGGKGERTTPGVQVEGGKRLKKALMPDALHPSPAGMELLAECLQPLMAKYGVKTGSKKPSRATAF